MKRDVPEWLGPLDDEDLMFLKRFLLVSGSLKDLAAEYAISYPTVRARLDRLIAKVKAADDAAVTDAFRKQLQILIADGTVSPDAARALLRSHEQALRENPPKR
jgi:hypothetical protein